MTSPIPDFQEDEMDGCCIYIAPDEATPDEDLPHAEGGVEGLHIHLEDDDDCCGTPIPPARITPDEALPITDGGVAQ